MTFARSLTFKLTITLFIGIQRYSYGIRPHVFTVNLRGLVFLSFIAINSLSVWIIFIFFFPPELGRFEWSETRNEHLFKMAGASFL